MADQKWQRPLWSFSRAYDWVGNRSPYGSTCTYNKVDELTDTDGQPGVEYTYDKLGNLLYKPNLQDWEIQYIYRGDNLLSDIYYLENGNTNGVCLTWDADGHRVNVNQDFVEEWTFMYDPTAGIPAVLFSVDDDYSSPVYTYNVREPGGGLLASFEPEGSNLHYYHFGALGSTVLVTNGNGTVSDSFAYDAWGNVLSTDNDTKPYQYVGQLGYYSHTSAQGSALEDLMQLGVRFYDPEIGRFTQRDPIRDGLNWYAYVGGRPSVVVDPFGLFSTGDFVDHYYGGSKWGKPGDTINLGKVGLLDNFQNAQSVKTAVNGFHGAVFQAMVKKAKEKCKCDKDGVFNNIKMPTIPGKTGTDVTGEPLLFAVGRSTFFFNATCTLSVDCSSNTISYKCSTHYYIRDWFEKPLDVGGELPGGTRYRINADWYSSLDVKNFDISFQLGGP